MVLIKHDDWWVLCLVSRLRLMEHVWEDELRGSRGGFLLDSTSGALFWRSRILSIDLSIHRRRFLPPTSSYHPLVTLLWRNYGTLYKKNKFHLSSLFNRSQFCRPNISRWIVEAIRIVCATSNHLIIRREKLSKDELFSYITSQSIIFQFLFFCILC